MQQSIPVVPIPPRSTPGIHIFAKKWEIINYYLAAEQAD